MALVLPTLLVIGSAAASPREGATARKSESALAAYRALAATQSRNYDKVQDISPRQLVILLEVSERTGADLGQLLATGEFESAHTWNNFVRPPCWLLVSSIRLRSWFAGRLRRVLVIVMKPAEDRNRDDLLAHLGKRL